MNEMAVNLTYC